MTEIQYQFLLKEPEIPMRIWYDYWIERGGQDMGLNKFEDMLSSAFANEPTIKVRSGNIIRMRRITFKSALDAFFEYYNQKFGYL